MSLKDSVRALARGEQFGQCAGRSSLTKILKPSFTGAWSVKDAPHRVTPSDHMTSCSRVTPRDHRQGQSDARTRDGFTGGERHRTHAQYAAPCMRHGWPSDRRRQVVDLRWRGEARGDWRD
eukprot:2952220-Prymnesium_polylepis.2